MGGRKAAHSLWRFRSRMCIMGAMPISADNPLFVLAVILGVGTLGGVAVRRLHLPSVTGQILAGVLLGPSALHLLGHDAAEALRPIVHFALGLIAVDVGTHLHFRRLRNMMRRLGLLLLMEATLTPLLVGAALAAAGREWPFALLFGTLAVSTAPATVIAVVKESRSKGVFVRTLVAAVALNNIACIAMFEMAAAAARADAGAGAVGLVLAPLRELGGAMLLGGTVGGLLVVATRHVVQTERLTTISVMSIFLTTGLADLAGVSNLLACLCLGMTIVNLAPAKEEIGHRVFVNFEPAILAIFFTLAGVELDFGFLREGWLLVVLFFGARAAGKVLGAGWAMRLAHAPPGIRNWLGPALLPQAGVAVGLLLDLRDDPAFADIAPLVLAVGVTAVALNEIVGPMATRLGLARSGNAGMDRARLIDFIHEENIVTGFEARTKEEALARLVDLLVTSHGLDIDRDEFLRKVLAREERMSTSIGRGLAVPHADLPAGTPMAGVMAVSRRGLPFGTPDGIPLRCMVLLAAPPEQADRRLEIQAVLARSVGSDWNLQIQLFNARTPAHVYEILHAEEAQDVNYFLDDPAAGGA